MRARGRTTSTPAGEGASSRSELISRLFAELDDSRVTWALLRGAATLGDVGRDVDLLVAEDDLLAAEHVLLRFGAVLLPASLPSWHRFYVVSNGPGSPRVVVDVVTRLIYHREVMLVTDLEHGCLARRRLVDGRPELSPTDAFWATLLHCLLDKHRILERRRTELAEHSGSLTRPSEPEMFFGALCPQDWTPDRAVTAVRRGEWERLSALGREILETQSATSTREGHERRHSDLGRLRHPQVTWRKHMGARARRVLALLYPTFWRAARLGSRFDVFDVLDEAAVRALLVTAERKVWARSCTLVVSDSSRPQVQSFMVRAGYRDHGGRWRRRTAGGVEHVEFRWAPAAGDAADALRLDEAPHLAGHPHMRWLPVSDLRRVVEDVASG